MGSSCHSRVGSMGDEVSQVVGGLGAEKVFPPVTLGQKSVPTRTSAPDPALTPWPASHWTRATGNTY